MGRGLGVGVGLGVGAQYLPPVFIPFEKSVVPPQTIISLPVQTAVCMRIGGRRVGRTGGCPAICARIVSAAGVEKRGSDRLRPRRSFHCRSRLQCASSRAPGALVVLVAVQVSVLGLYLPPVLKDWPRYIRPRRSFHCRSRRPCDRIGR